MMRTPITIAIGGGYLSIVEEFIKKITDPTEIDNEDFFGDTALIIAVTKGHIPMIKTLINAGANVNYLNHNNMTALTFTIQIFNFYTHQKLEEANAKKLEIMDVLIANGADVNLKDSKGNTPLMIAATKNQKKIIQKLLDCGADPKIKNGKNDFYDVLKYKKTKDWIFKYVDGFEAYKVGE
jgi:ankyrin repeat protein